MEPGRFPFPASPLSPVPPRRRHDNRVNTGFAPLSRLPGLHSLALFLAGRWYLVCGLICAEALSSPPFAFLPAALAACMLMWVVISCQIRTSLLPGVHFVGYFSGSISRLVASGCFCSERLARARSYSYLMRKMLRAILGPVWIH